jgi:Domain of unknown function (DUF3332)
MRKVYYTVAVVLAVGASLLFNSCIGSFALTNNVLTWNKQVGSKFVNELVFFAFWVLPVYEVTALADVVVLNSIEFWSGTNPITASTKIIDTDSGRYLVKCDGKGYTITCQATGEETRLNFCEENQTWSVNVDGTDYPFMTFVDSDHVKMITPSGDFKTVEISERGVMAYSDAVKSASLAAL